MLKKRPSDTKRSDSPASKKQGQSEGNTPTAVPVVKQEPAEAAAAAAPAAAAAAAAPVPAAAAAAAPALNALSVLADPGNYMDLSNDPLAAAASVMPPPAYSQLYPAAAAAAAPAAAAAALPPRLKGKKLEDANRYLQEAVEAEDIGFVDRGVQKGGKINHTVDANGKNLLHVAAGGSSPAVFDHLVNVYQLKLTDQTTDGRGVLDFFQHHAMKKHVLANYRHRFRPIVFGTAVTLARHNEELLIAARAGDIAWLEELVAARADIHYTDADGAGVQHYAARAGHVPMLSHLDKYRLDYTKTTKHGEDTVAYCLKDDKDSNVPMMECLAKRISLTRLAEYNQHHQRYKTKSNALQKAYDDAVKVQIARNRALLEAAQAGKKH